MDAKNRAILLIHGVLLSKELSKVITWVFPSRIIPKSRFILQDESRFWELSYLRLNLIFEVILDVMRKAPSFIVRIIP